MLYGLAGGTMSDLPLSRLVVLHTVGAGMTEGISLRQRAVVAARRRRPRGHIETRPNGRFRAIVYAGVDPLTRQARVSPQDGRDLRSSRGRADEAPRAGRRAATPAQRGHRGPARREVARATAVVPRVPTAFGVQPQQRHHGKHGRRRQQDREPARDAGAGPGGPVAELAPDGDRVGALGPPHRSI